MMGLGTTELVLILVLALVLFGPGRLPDVGRAVGRGIRDFKDALGGGGGGGGGVSGSGGGSGSGGEDDRRQIGPG